MCVPACLCVCVSVFLNVVFLLLWAEEWVRKMSPGSCATERILATVPYRAIQCYLCAFIGNGRPGAKRKKNQTKPNQAVVFLCLSICIVFVSKNSSFCGTPRVGSLLSNLLGE
mmetsp:Transcript_13152/g.27831  ORF Transcript_13152/g.27831 Transcript_13152/m.27831 type:complete len:113 (+) Transcript_13152:933-1271(+)